MNAGYLEVEMIVPAAAGWRRVSWGLPKWEATASDIDTAEDSDLLNVSPIACFALGTVEGDPGERIHVVVPVIVEDWPSVLSFEYEHAATTFGIGYLGPGEELDEEHGAEARRLAHKWLEERSS